MAWGSRPGLAAPARASDHVARRGQRVATVVSLMPAFDAIPLSFEGGSELMLCRPHEDDSVHSDEFRKRGVHTLARTMPARATQHVFSVQHRAWGSTLAARSAAPRVPARSAERLERMRCRRGAAKLALQANAAAACDAAGTAEGGRRHKERSRAKNAAHVNLAVRMSRLLGTQRPRALTVLHSVSNRSPPRSLLPPPRKANRTLAQTCSAARQ